MKKISLIICLLMAMIMSSCGDDTQFRVAGVINGMGTQNIRVLYCSAGSVKSFTSTVIDGKFSFVGNSPELTIVGLYTNNKTLLALLAVKNGETIECELQNNNRYTMTLEGSDVVSQLSKFTTEHAQTLDSDDIESRNRAIAQYVDKNRSKLSSTILMLTEFYTPGNEQLADSLLSLIDIEARPRHLIDSYASTLTHITSDNALGNVLPMNLYEKGDSLVNFNASKSAYAILAFTMPDRECRDSIVPSLKSLRKAHETDRLNILDISFAPDTTQWKRSIATDSADWAQCWVLGSVQAKGVDRLAITRTPFFIVTDSTGAQLYRGTSISNARDIVTKNLTKE